MDWAIYNMLYLLNETLQRDNISIITKVKPRSFEWCIVCLSQKCLWTKLQGKDQSFGIIPPIYFGLHILPKNIIL